MKYIGLMIMVVAACDTRGPPASREVKVDRPVSQGAPVVESVNEVERVEPIAREVVLGSVTPPAVTLETLCAPIATATCRTHLGCRSGVSREVMLACEAHIMAACEAERPALEARVAAERLRFDAVAWRDCQAYLDMAVCAPPGDMQAALGGRCDGVLVGRLGRGEACEDAGDCASGLACTTANGACPGVCAPQGAQGERCDAELAPCAPGLSCEAGRCALEHVAVGQACVVTAQCPVDAFCEDVEAGAGCVLRLATGEACSDDEQCAVSDYCDFVSLGEDAVLEVGACARRRVMGAACDPLIGGCAEGLACDDARGECVAVPDSAGEGCVADVAPCGAGTGLVCEAAVCELEPFVGDACEPGGAPCRFGYCAAGAASGIGECTAFLAPAAACGDDAQCGALACVDGRCGRDATRCIATRHDINLGFRYRIR